MVLVSSGYAYLHGCVGGELGRYFSILEKTVFGVRRIMNKRKKEGAELRRRRDALGLKCGEFAVLFSRTTRCLAFYISGERRIPPDVWATLEDLEKLSRETLARKIIAARNRRR